MKNALETVSASQTRSCGAPTERLAARMLRGVWYANYVKRVNGVMIRVESEKSAKGRESVCPMFDSAKTGDVNVQPTIPMRGVSVSTADGGSL